MFVRQGEATLLVASAANSGSWIITAEGEDIPILSNCNDNRGMFQRRALSPVAVVVGDITY